MPDVSDVLVRPDGTRIAYDVMGAGPPVVFLHGLTSSRASWDPVTARLADGFTCVRVDLRGHGGSSAGPDLSTLAMVGDVHAVVQELGLGTPAVVGHSLGSTLAGVYAAAHAPRAVVCVDGSLRFGDFARLVQPHAERLHGERPLEVLLEIDHALGLAPYTGVAEMERRILAFAPAVLLGIWERLLTVPPDELTALAEAILPQVACPLLSLHGAPPPADYEAWLARLVPTARVEVWDGLGHMLHLVDPERFAARVRPFLAD